MRVSGKIRRTKSAQVRVLPGRAQRMTDKRKKPTLWLGIELRDRRIPKTGARSNRFVWGGFLESP